MNEYIDSFMLLAIDISIENISRGGGPFGAVIAKDGNIIVSAGNSVTQSCDPTAHAEINAIRAAGSKLSTHDLTGCVLYSSCEPCPMCLSAIYWAGIETVYFANSKLDAAEAGFKDAFIYEELSVPNAQKSIEIVYVSNPRAIKAFDNWSLLDNKADY